MILALLAVPALALALWWLFASPLRLVAIGVPVVIVHPAMTLGLTALVTAAMAAVTALIVVRSSREFGWRLVHTGRPRAAQARHAR